MKKTVSLAVLAILVAGQAQAAGRAGNTNSSVNANATTEAATNAARVDISAAKERIKELRKKISESATGKTLTSAQVTNLLRAMSTGNDAAKITEAVNKILADKEATELNQVALVGLSNLGVKSTASDALTNLGVNEQKEAMRVLFVDLLGGTARAWKAGSELSNAIAFGKMVNDNIASGMDQVSAMNKSVAKFQEMGFSRMTIDQLKKLCGSKA